MSRNSSSRGIKKQEPNLQFNLKMNQRIDQTTTHGNTGERETKAGFITFPRRVLETPIKRSRGAELFAQQRRCSWTRRHDEPGKAETGQQETYTQKYIQSSPALVVLRSKKNNPISNNKKITPLRAECGNSEGGANRSLGTRDSATAGRCLVPARGPYNPLGPEYTTQVGGSGRMGVKYSGQWCPSQ